MNKYTKTKLVVITKRSSYARQYRDFADFFHITTASVFPHMIKIIFSANTLYAVDPELKNRHKVSYTTIKLFNKRLTKLKLLSTLFSINKIMKQTIFIPHNYLTLNMYLYHMPSNWHEKTAILCTDTNKQDPESDPSLDKFLNTILINFKNGTYLPDLEFNGNIFITNTLSSKLIDLLILKFPNVCQICIKQLDTLIEDPIEATLTHELKKRGTNSIKTYKQIQNLKKRDIILSSYSRTEADYLKISYEPNVVNFRMLQARASEKRNINYSLFFAGNATGLRFNKILSILNVISATSLSALFVLTNLSNTEKQQVLKLNLPNRITVKFNGSPYDKFIDLEIHSEIIIDLYRKTPDEGYSYRISECLALNKKILTDRDSVYQEFFYDKRMIFVSKDLTITPTELLAFAEQKNIAYQHTDAYDISNSFICSSTKVS